MKLVTALLLTLLHVGVLLATYLANIPRGAMGYEC
jgi:hypothetical protein